MMKTATVENHLRYATLLLALLGIACVGPAMAEVLIRPEEAALPPGKLPPDFNGQSLGISRPPKIELVLPPQPLKSPFALNIVFTAHQDLTINPDRVRVVYVKDPEIPLTERLRQNGHISASGISMPNAEAPPGEHVLLVDVMDSQGHRTRAAFTIKINP
jgi:hypothetical protein